MPASVSLLGLSCSTPDGSTLFTNLNQSFGAERTGLVGRNGAGKTTLLRVIAGDLRPSAGQVRLIGSAAMMRQDTMDQPDAIIADLFGVRPALESMAKAEAGIADADELADADWTLPSRLEAALLRCGLSAGYQAPLAMLSGGQRSRAAFAALIFAEPDFLLLDEPTNNLDREGRKSVIDLIRGWTGGAIIASHDRDLLEEMDHIVELSALGASRYGGNYSAYRAWKSAELDIVARDLGHAEKARADVARRAQEAHERKARRDAAGHRARAKADKPKILMDAAKNRAEASGGAGVRLRDARREAAEQALVAARDKIEVLQPLHMDIAATGLALNKTVLRLDRVTGGYTPDYPVIRDFSLSITGPEHIVISGPNGSGKTTLLKLISGQIIPQHGRVDIGVPFALLDQHVGLLDPTRTLREEYMRLHPIADAHAAHAALARFGFRAADALRYVGELSGGERVRAGLACVLGGTPTPMLLILDEPTNHLDLDGLAALEAALRAYDGAVLAVSHDESFLKVLRPNRVITLGRA